MMDEPIPIVEGRRRKLGWAPDGRKICPNCQEPTNPDDFYASSSYCRRCGPQVVRRQQELREQREPGKYREERRRIKLKSRYKLTLEDYNEILAAQGGVCGICKKDEPRRGNDEFFSVDHDHDHCPGERSCGKCTRGLLCYKCNTGIGYLEDDPDRLRAAADYIEKFRANREVA